MTDHLSLFDIIQLPFRMIPPTPEESILLNKIKISPLSVQYVEVDIEISEGF